MQKFCFENNAEMYKLKPHLNDVELREFQVTHTLGGSNSQVYLASRDDSFYAIKAYSLD